MKRKINEIIIHCSSNERYSGITFADIRHDHIKNRGFKDIGYHYVINENGVVTPGRSLSLSGAHCKNHNAHSIGICYLGGLQDGFPLDTRTIPQKKALKALISNLCDQFPITKINGHNEYSNKSCPCFDAKKEYSHLIQKLL